MPSNGVTTIATATGADDSFDSSVITEGFCASRPIAAQVFATIRPDAIVRLVSKTGAEPIRLCTRVVSDLGLYQRSSSPTHHST